MPQALISLLTVLIGALGTYLIQTLLSSRNTDLAEINEHIAEISKIEDCAVEHWTIDASKDAERANAKALAAKLRGLVGVTSAFRERARHLLGDSFEAYVRLDDQLLDAATGGSFEQHDREPDLDRVVEVMVICHQIRRVLRRARKRRHWAH